MTVDSAANESRCFEDHPVRWFLLATAFWAVVAAALTIVLSLLLLMPKLFYELGDTAQHFSFGRLYPTQMQLIVYGVLSNGFFSFVYYAIQRFENVRLNLVPLAMLHFLVWQGMIIVATIASVNIETQGKWLNWREWPFSVALVAIWVLMFAPVVVTTLRRRTAGSRLPASLWFVIATILAIPLLLIVGNLQHPQGPIYLGVQDVMLQWWSARGLVSFWLTVPAVAMLYFLVPRVSEGHLYSYRLTVIHFWSIALLGCWGGNFQWHLTAVPDWADSIAMFAGLLLWLGCLGGAYNLWRSLPKSVNRLERSVVQRLITAAVVCYAIYAIDSAWMSLKGSTSATQFTDWVIANQMLAILGVSGLSIIAFSLVAIPNLSAVHVDPKRGVWIRWLAVEGASFQIIALYVAGQFQATSWNQLNELGRLENPEFVNAILWVQPLWTVVAIGALIWFVGMFCWFALVLRTMLVATPSSTPIDSIEVSTQPDPIVVPSRLVGAPVLGAAIGLEQWAQLAWHARIEKHGFGIVVRVATGLTVGTLLIWLPSFLYRGSTVEGAAITQSPYTDLERVGREIYVREGCVSCHTQAARPLVPEVLRYGNFSHASDYADDRPTQLGTRRVGPDLAREGGRQTSLWHWKHLENPQSVTPESVMPAFDHVLNQPLGAGDNKAMVQQAESIAADIVGAGGPALYGDDLLMNSRGVALIAYLQRLGVVTPPNPTK